MFEQLLISHCAPTLAGIKVANMFMYNGSNPYRDVKHWNNILNAFGLKLMIIKKSENKALIYIYRVSMLSHLLNLAEIQNFLKDYGYTNFDDMSSILNQLVKRFKYSSFPHEIGIFLGYPLEDVKMFILNKGKNYKCCGIWKVYCNEKKSTEIFESYKHCTSSFLDLFLSGKNITSLCVA